MSGSHDSTELSAADRLVAASLTAPLAVETETRLRNRLLRLREELQCQTVSASIVADQRRTSIRLALLLCLVFAVLLVWSVRLGSQKRAEVNPPAKNDPVPARVSPATSPASVIEPTLESTDDGGSPDDSAPSSGSEDLTPITLAQDDEGYGTLTGQFVLSGMAPVLPPLMADARTVRDFSAKCNPTIPDESLLVDRTTNGIKNIVVYLRKTPAKIHPALVTQNHSPLNFDAKCGRFTPHVLFVQANQPVICRSLDPLSYNVHTFPMRNLQANVIVGPTPTPIMISPTFAERLPTKVVDDIHPWMSAYWLILDHPYAAITVRSGQFAVRRLPVGTHEFQVWHERAGYLNKSLQVTIASQQQTDLGVMPITATQLQ